MIGGDNKNQFFCLSLPGTLLAPESFRFDYKHNAPKPSKVEANESRLVNKLFDAPGKKADNSKLLIVAI